MENMISFAQDNYVWFIVGGVILIMALIGFIAEKTDFGRKGKKNKEKPVEPIQEKVEEPLVAPVIEPEPIMFEDPIFAPIEVLNEETPIEEVAEETVVPEVFEAVAEVPVEETVTEEVAEAPVEETSEEITSVDELAPVEEVTEEAEAPELEPIKPIDIDESEDEMWKF